MRVDKPSISKTCTAWPSGGCRRSRSTSSRAGSRTSAGSTATPRPFTSINLLPRYLVDVSKRDQSQTIFGRTFASPFGISPTGGAGLFRRGADMMLAEAARDANIPYIMSGASNDSIEAAARVAPNNAWYQLYAARDGKISEDLIRRAADAGLGALVLTVDVPVHSKRERNMRNGFANIRGSWLQAALSLKPAILAEAMTHPGWVVEYIRHGGTPALGNWLPYAAPTAPAPRRSIKFNRSQVPAHAADLARPRTLPPAVPAHPGRQGHHGPAPTRSAPPRSAATASSCRTTAARQLDQAPASLDVLPAIKAAVGDRHDGDARQRRAARRRHPDRDVPRRAVRASSAARPSTARWPAGCPGSRRRSTSSAPRSTS